MYHTSYVVVLRTCVSSLFLVQSVFCSLLGALFPQEMILFVCCRRSHSGVAGVNSR